MAPVSDPNDQKNASEDVQSVAKNRSRRTVKDRHGRLSALERLKKAKAAGGKNKYEVAEESSVYEEVDEKEYTRIVQDRQEDDWIVDDDGGGYVEDGREIFDDDLGEPVGGTAAGDRKMDKKRKNPNIRAPDTKAKNIRSMFAAASVRSKPKAQKDVNLTDDNILDDIMAELHNEPSPSLAPPPVKLKKKAVTPRVVNPFSTKVTPKSAPPFSRPPPPTRQTVASVTAEAASPILPTKPKPITPIVAPPLTALDSCMDMDDDDIGDFSTQSSDKENHCIDKPSQASQKEAESSAVDMSGIDFDDDSGLESTNTAKAAMDVDFQLAAGGEVWETQKGSFSQEVPPEVHVDPGSLPLITDTEGNQVLRMYWLDAYEDPFKQPGVVYLFGKIAVEKTFVSCCLTVRNIERRMYLLPRKTRKNLRTGEETDNPVTFLDVYQEFNDKIADKHKIMKFKSLKVCKEYAFEIENIPASSDYLELRYSAEYPALPENLFGETFSHIFGTKTSSLELLLLDRKMKGPGWIDIKFPQVPQAPCSWCKVEALVMKPDHISVLTTQSAIPPLITMALTVRTITNPKTHQNEVIAVACLIQHEFYMDKAAPKPLFQQHFCAMSKPSDTVFPFDFREKVQKQAGSMKIEIMGTERALLGFLLAKIHKVDPDIIVGHDIYGFDLDVLLHRIQHSKIPHWSRLGRLKRSNMPKLNTPGSAKASSAANACSGRLICDVKISAKELIRCRSYDLTELVSHILKDKRQEIDPDQIRSIYGNSGHLLQFTEITLIDARLVLRILYELNVIPLALQITNICGNVMSRTLMGGRSERNEYLLLHAFHEKGFLLPDKQYGVKKQAHVENDEDGDESQATSAKKSRRRKPAYAGGLVLEPKKGFYDKYILLLDFNSLYPSIIQEFNICFTTINQGPIKSDDPDDLPPIPDSDLEPGVLPTEIRKLVQSRRQVKQLMKAPDLSSDLYMQYDIRQKALKLTANSMYGCLGFTFSRFYARPLAALVTSKGREILMKTKDLVQGMNLDVIYGDTDSIMVNTNSTDIDHVYKLGHKVKSEVNKLYRLLEIDIDGVFKSMLLLKKKKYAALTVAKVGDKYVTSQELKGLDIVRRDWCELAKEAGNFVVNQILSGEARDSIVENIHAKLIEVGEKVKDGDIPVELYQITKQLTKHPEDYPDKKSLPHVQVALRINSKGGKQMRAGDTVYYVICQDGSNLGPSQRGYHTDELAKREDLKIDTKYYLANQVHPVVTRLCDPIDGTDAAHIAECLGLDASAYKHSSHDNDEDEALLGGGGQSEEEKYKDCDRFKISCPDCAKEMIFDAVFTGVGRELQCTLSHCTSPQCQRTPATYLPLIMNRLTILIRHHLNRYYQAWLQCEDSTCSIRMKRTTLTFHRGHPICPVCQKGILHAEYTDSDLYNQLSFYQFMFDYEKAFTNLKDPNEMDAARFMKTEHQGNYNKLRDHVRHTIKQSSYSQVDLSRLFQGMFTLK